MNSLIETPTTLLPIRLTIAKKMEKLRIDAFSGAAEAVKFLVHPGLPPWLIFGLILIFHIIWKAFPSGSPVTGRIQIF
jgi:hypothetical protein